MINPVLAYYQIRMLVKQYMISYDDTDIIFLNLAEELMKHYRDMKFKYFKISTVFRDGECLIQFYDWRPDTFVELKDVLFYDSEGSL